MVAVIQQLKYMIAKKKKNMFKQEVIHSPDLTMEMWFLRKLINILLLCA